MVVSATPGTLVAQLVSSVPADVMNLAISSLSSDSPTLRAAFFIIRHLVIKVFKMKSTHEIEPYFDKKRVNHYSINKLIKV
jgi:hypothetical protein